ncbi:MAG: beta-glucosidase [Burkholderiales bacterium]|jgi:beta-glucosidase/6-phospho-beta-glucosidase/beta-galactosidase|nr:beta-glucosidase [Burkholderiales bacterium]
MFVQKPLFNSFFHGGFECSTHRRIDGKRLDVIKDTAHDKHALEDYLALISHGINTARDGIRWHLIETFPGYYDWSSFLPMLRAARESKMQVIWDICHYGWPDDIDIWKPEFVHRFTNFAVAVAKLIKSETDEIPFYSPVNEISFWSWAGGEVGYLNPHVQGRGFELKQQLVCATISAIEAIRQIDSRARFIQAEPLINIVSPSLEKKAEAAMHNEAQYQVWDMLSGNICPGLGGRKDLLDIIGVNYYSDNQWYLSGPKIHWTHPEHEPLANLLNKVFRRYNHPVFISETGIEGDLRPQWIRYICDEVRSANLQGVAIEGVCLYPVTDYPGWDDERHCPTGLLGIADQYGERIPHTLLAEEIKQQKNMFELHQSFVKF